MKKDLLSVVIVSDARLNGEVTRECIKSLNESGHHEIIVVESCPKTTYEGCIVIKPDVPFNYNAYLNLGAKKASGYYIAFCNNDLIFDRNWWARMHTTMIDNDINSASPICPNTHSQFGFHPSDKVEFGNEIRKHVAGWCLVLDRLWYIGMGGFDEDYSFWCADNSYGKQLEKHKQLHALDLGSVVYHLESVSLNKLDDHKKNEYTIDQVKKFNRKFNDNIFNL